MKKYKVTRSGQTKEGKIISDSFTMHEINKSTVIRKLKTRFFTDVKVEKI